MIRCLNPPLVLLSVLASVALGALTAGSLPAAADGPQPSLFEAARLEADDLFALADFGAALSIDRDRLAIGAPDADFFIYRPGRAYVFERSETTGEWTQTASIVDPEQDFGGAVAIDGDILAVGNILRDPGGAVHVYERDPGEPAAWREVAILGPDDGAAGDKFGYAVGLRGNVLAVAARGHGHREPSQGAVYVYFRDREAGWVQVDELLAPDAAAFDGFGQELAIEGNTLVVLAPFAAGEFETGKAYVIERDPVTGQFEFMATLQVQTRAEETSYQAIALSGDVVALGAGGDLNTVRGQVFLFHRDAGGPDAWGQVAELEAWDRPGLLLGDLFGRSVALAGDTLVVGANSNIDGSGGAYVFRRRPSRAVWEPTFKLNGPQRYSLFGSETVLGGGHVVVAAPDAGGQLIGVVHVYDAIAVDPWLEASGACPGAVVLTAGGLTPGGLARFYASVDSGSAIVETGLCAGLELDLAEPRKLAVVRADAQGTIVTEVTLEAAACGQYLQVVDVTSCAMTPALQLP